MEKLYLSNLYKKLKQRIGNRMINIVLTIVLSIITGTLSAQDITGQWNGTLDVQGTQLELVFHIEQSDSGYGATFDSPDQGAKDIPFTSATYDAPNLKLEAGNIGAIYEGKLENNSITGTWKQGGQSFPLTLSKQVDLTGDWSGSYKSVQFIFRIRKAGEIYETTLDIPTNSLKDISMSSTDFRQDTLVIDGRNIGLKFEGNLSEDSSIIKGTLTEGVNTVPLRLTRGKTKTNRRTKRSQEPEKPYPYQEEDVRFKNEKAGITLGGTLTLPAKKGVHPAVVLITGSGPQNRDEELFGHRPFLVLADYLTRQGIAVLRYDDRGINESTGTFTTSTTKDFASDALSAVAYLKSRKEINTGSIGLIGHSEGGIVAPMAANQSDDVAFIVMLAGTGIPGTELSIYQSMALADFEIPDKKAYEKYVREAVAIASADKEVSVVRKELTDFYRNSALLAELLPSNIDKALFIDNLVETRTSPWMRYFYTHNPADELRKVKVPVLSLNGSNDVSVPADMNLPPIRKALEDGNNKDYLVKELPGLNHMFQKSETGAMSEYSTIEQTFSPLALNEITRWVKDQVKK